MTNRRIDGFFYGLFMDNAVLHEQGIEPELPRHAYVDDYELRIGKRATLVPKRGARAYGMVIALTHHELDLLYNAPGLQEYRPEPVVAHTLAGETLPALCYNLRLTPEGDEANAEYAQQLREVLGRLGFPSDYIASVS